MTKDSKNKALDNEEDSSKISKNDIESSTITKSKTQGIESKQPLTPKDKNDIK
ncbi:hypothetical protein [Helicobacter bilis]|nr:hypothetical protein [Helicobacter bilis]